MKRTLKFLHTVSSAGLVGGLACYALLLVYAPRGEPTAFVEWRHGIAAVSDYLLLPSLGVALVSGLLAMAVHTPYLDKQWVWVKAAMGILMFKGVLTVIGASSAHAKVLASQLEAGTVEAGAFGEALQHEWYALVTIAALSLANIALGVWRPRRLWPRPSERVAIRSEQ